MSTDEIIIRIAHIDIEPSAGSRHSETETARIFKYYTDQLQINVSKVIKQGSRDDWQRLGSGWIIKEVREKLEYAFSRYYFPGGLQSEINEFFESLGFLISMFKIRAGYLSEKHESKNKELRSLLALLFKQVRKVGEQIYSKKTSSTE